MPDQAAKIEAMEMGSPERERAEMMIRKAGLIRTVRDELAKQGVVYWVGLTEILDAIERARGEEPGKDAA